MAEKDSEEFLISILEQIAKERESKAAERLEQNEEIDQDQDQMQQDDQDARG